MEFFLQLFFQGLSIGFLYALAALGFVMIFKSSSVLNFAHGELLAIGAFIFLVLASWAQSTHLACLFDNHHRKFRSRVYHRTPLSASPDWRSPHRGHYADGWIGRHVQGNHALYLRWKFAQLSGLPAQKSFDPDGVPLIFRRSMSPRLLSVLIFLVIFGLFFKYSSQGIYMRSVADNQPAALSLGVHVRRVFALSWAIAALVCAMSGIILGIINGINVHELSHVGLKVFPVVILGGLESIGGAIIGGVIIGLLETFTGGYISTSLREIVPYIVLVFILLVKPYGLFGLVEIERV